MKTSIAVVLALALGASASALSQQQPQVSTVVKTEPGKGLITSTVELSATVEAIDLPTRSVTLKGATGKSVTLAVDEQARNLDQVKVGDQVVVKYVEALSLELKKGGGGAVSRTEAETGVRAEPGQKPGAGVGRKVTVLADVVAIDQKNKLVTLRGPKQTVDLRVQDPEQLKLIKKGDQVQATYLEAMAVAVEPAPKAGAKK